MLCKAVHFIFNYWKFKRVFKTKSTKIFYIIEFTRIQNLRSLMLLGETFH